MANPKIFTFREVATHTGMNDLVDDVRKDYIMHGLGSSVANDALPGFNYQSAATSQPGSPDFIFPLHVPTGQFVNVAYRMVAPSGTVSAAFVFDGPGGIDTLDLNTDSGDKDFMVSKDITALIANGDLRGVPCDLQVFLWGSIGPVDLYVHWIRSTNYSAAADNWFL